MFALAAPAAAHQPHDPVEVVAVSPAFADDGFVLAARHPNQNWRPPELAASSDGGRTWRQAFRGLTAVAPFSDADLSPTFAADGTALVTTRGEGAWWSTDRGERWTRLPTPESDLLAGALALDGGLVLVVAPAAGGLLRSVDGGATWLAVPGPAVDALAAHGATVAIAAGRRVAVSHDAGATFTAALLDAEVASLAAGDGVVAAATATGAWLAREGGPFARADGFPDALTRIGVAPDFAATPVVLATRAAEGVWVSTDGGATAARSAPEVELSPQTDDHYEVIAFSGTFAEDATAFVGSFEGLLATSDGGASWWESDTRPPGLINAIAASPRFADDGALLVASYDAGVWASLDGGRTFAIRNGDLRLSSVYDVALAPRGDGVEAALALNAQVYLGAPPFDGWTWRPLPAEADYTTRIALSPRWETDGTALAGTRVHGVWRTTDRGATWAPASGDLAAISGLEWGPDGHTVLAGTKDGALARSPDDGRTWFDVAAETGGASPAWVASGPAGFLVGGAAGLLESVDGQTFAAVGQPLGPVQAVTVAPDGTAFASLRGGGLWRRAPSGDFVPVGAGLTDQGTASELAASPTFAVDGAVFAAVDEDLWRSDDGGETFARIGMDRVRYEEDCQAFTPPFRPIDAPAASTRGVGEIAPGGRVSLVVRGVGFVVIGEEGPDLGTLELRVDGAAVGAVDQRGAASAPQEQLRIGPLADGVHTLELAAVGDRPVRVDAVDVLRTMAEAPAPDTGDTGLDAVLTGARPLGPGGGPGSGGCGCGGGGATPGLAALAALSARRARSARADRRGP